MPLRQTVGAEHSLADESDLDRGVGHEELGHRGFDGARLIFLGEPGGSVEHEATGFELGARFGEIVANRLVRADGSAELSTLLCIGPGFFDRCLCDSEGDCADLDLLDVQGLAGQHAPAPVPCLFASDEILDRDFDIFEDHIARERVAKVGMFDRVDLHTGEGGWNEDEGEVSVALVRRPTANQTVDVVDPIGACAPALEAVDLDVLAVCGKIGRRRHACEVTSDLGFGEAVRE